MASLPTTKSAGKITALFDKIYKTGIPSKANLEWLKSMGFTSSRDQSMIPMLKALGYVDGSSQPTNLWKAWKDKNNGPLTLAQAIRDSYSELFSAYPDANVTSDSDLKNLLNTLTGGGEEAVGQYLSTFQSLVKLAKWEDYEGTSTNRAENSDIVLNANGKEVIRQRNVATDSGLTVNLNIQLSLPDTLDQAGYEAFFAAMKKHLFPGSKDE